EAERADPLHQRLAGREGEVVGVSAIEPVANATVRVSEPLSERELEKPEQEVNPPDLGVEGESLEHRTELTTNMRGWVSRAVSLQRNALKYPRSKIRCSIFLKPSSASQRLTSTALGRQ